ncbi:IS110 family transposase, partial [Achromobacter xylosoxidans]
PAFRPACSEAGPPRVRAMLYMAAIVGTRFNPHVQALYARRLLAGKSKMPILCAAMRKLAQPCFGVLKPRSPYRPSYV